MEFLPEKLQVMTVAEKTVETQGEKERITIRKKSEFDREEVHEIAERSKLYRDRSRLPHY